MAKHGGATHRCRNNPPTTCPQLGCVAGTSAIGFAAGRFASFAGTARIANSVTCILAATTPRCSCGRNAGHGRSSTAGGGADRFLSQLQFCGQHRLQKHRVGKLVQCLFPSLVFGAVLGLVFVRWRTAPSCQGRCPRCLGSGAAQLPANRADHLARSRGQLGGDPSVAGARGSASPGFASCRAQFTHLRSAIRSGHGQLLECGDSPSQCARRTAQFARCTKSPSFGG